MYVTKTSTLAYLPSVVNVCIVFVVVATVVVFVAGC